MPPISRVRRNGQLYRLSQLFLLSDVIEIIAIIDYRNVQLF